MILTNSGMWKAMQQSLLCLSMTRRTSACMLEASATWLNFSATSILQCMCRKVLSKACRIDKLEQRREHVGRALRPDSRADPGASCPSLANDAKRRPKCS